MLFEEKVIVHTTGHGATFKRATTFDVSRAEAVAAKAKAKVVDDERRMTELRGELASAEKKLKDMDVLLAKSKPYLDVQDAAKVVMSVSARGAAGKAVDALMEMLTQSGSSIYNALRKSLPSRKTDLLAIAHQNMAACYDMNGGPGSFERKLVNVLTIAAFFKIDVMVCSEVPCPEALEWSTRHRATDGGPLCCSKLPPRPEGLPDDKLSEEQKLHERLRHLLKDGVWNCRVSDSISPQDCKKHECIMWLWRTTQVRIVDGEPMVLNDAEARACSWVRPAACSSILQFLTA